MNLNTEYEIITSRAVNPGRKDLCMENKLKHRGKPITGEKGVIGFYCQTENDDGSINHYILTHKLYTRQIMDLKNYMIQVIPETVGRCSELNDKTGKLVFENDIVKYHQLYYIVRYGAYNVNPENCAPAYVIGWYLELCSSMFNGLSSYNGKTDPMYNIDSTAAMFPAHCAVSEAGIEDLKLVVVGNIFDNPEFYEPESNKKLIEEQTQFIKDCEANGAIDHEKQKTCRWFGSKRCPVNSGANCDDCEIYIDYKIII